MKEFVQRTSVTELDPQTKRKKTKFVKKLVRRYDHDERVMIIREFLTGKYTAQQIMAKYMINAQATLFSWLAVHITEAQSLTLQEDNENDSEMANKSKDDQIRELKAKLRQAEKHAPSETMLAQFLGVANGKVF